MSRLRQRGASLAALLVQPHALRSARALTRGAAHPVLAQALQSAAYSLPQRTRTPALLRAAGWTTPRSLTPSRGRVSKRSSRHHVKSYRHLQARRHSLPGATPRAPCTRADTRRGSPVCSCSAAAENAGASLRRQHTTSAAAVPPPPPLSRCALAPPSLGNAHAYRRNITLNQRAARTAFFASAAPPPPPRRRRVAPCACETARPGPSHVRLKRPCALSLLRDAPRAPPFPRNSAHGFLGL